LAPSGQVSQHVGPHQEEQLALRAFRPEMGQGIDRVAQAAAVDLVAAERRGSLFGLPRLREGRDVPALHKAPREGLRIAIEEMTVVHEDYKIQFTISIGFAEWDPELVSHEQWIDCADQALYEAKESGRNQVVQFKKVDAGPMIV
jgi:GGDEF domain-containing protein